MDLSVELDGPRVGEGGARDLGDEGRLPRPVGADDGVSLMLEYVEIDTVRCSHPAEMPGEAPDAEERHRHPPVLRPERVDAGGRTMIGNWVRRLRIDREAERELPERVRRGDPAPGGREPAAHQPAPARRGPALHVPRRHPARPAGRDPQSGRRRPGSDRPRRIRALHPRSPVSLVARAPRAVGPLPLPSSSTWCSSSPLSGPSISSTGNRRRSISRPRP